eukprot:g56698.t1
MMQSDHIEDTSETEEEEQEDLSPQTVLSLIDKRIDFLRRQGVRDDHGFNSNEESKGHQNVYADNYEFSYAHIVWSVKGEDKIKDEETIRDYLLKKWGKEYFERHVIMGIKFTLKNRISIGRFAMTRKSNEWNITQRAQNYENACGNADPVQKEQALQDAAKELEEKMKDCEGKESFKLKLREALQHEIEILGMLEAGSAKDYLSGSSRSRLLIWIIKIKAHFNASQESTYLDHQDQG